jgi:hypothetical protein
MFVPTHDVGSQIKTFVTFLVATPSSVGILTVALHKDAAISMTPAKRGPRSRTKHYNSDCMGTKLVEHKMRVTAMIAGI